MEDGSKEKIAAESTPSESWYKTNLFWGCFSVFFGVVFSTLAYAIESVTLARLFLPLAWIAGMVACWCVVRYSVPWVKLATHLSVALVLIIGLVWLYEAVEVKHWNPSAPQPVPKPREPTARPKAELSDTPPKDIQEPSHQKRERPAHATPIKADAPGNEPPISRPGSISQSNSGGINIQQATTGKNSPIINSPITVGDIPRGISETGKTALAAYFLGATNKARVKIFADQISGSVPFPDDFYGVLKSGQWEMVEAGVNNMIGFGPPGKRFQGAIVTVKGDPRGPGEIVYFADSEPITFIGRALESLKVSRILKRDESQAEGLIVIQFEGGFPR